MMAPPDWVQGVDHTVREREGFMLLGEALRWCLARRQQGHLVHLSEHPQIFGALEAWR
jgi:hypothetical protein